MRSIAAVFDTLGTKTFRYLGVLLDNMLTLRRHCQYVRDVVSSRLNGMSSIAALIHPRVGRAVALTLAAQLLYGGEALYSIMLDILDGELGPTWHRTVCQLGHMVKSAPTSDSIMTLGCETLPAILTRRAIQWRYRRSTLPPLFFPMFSGIARYQSSARHMAASRAARCSPTLIDPATVLGHPFPENIFPYRYPAAPHPPAFVDRIHLHWSDDTPPSTDEERLTRNCASRSAVYALVPESHIIEGWSDGSVEIDPDNPDNPMVGGAAVIFDEGPDHCLPRGPEYIELVAAPSGSCSYTTEVFAALALCKLATAAATAERPHRPHISLVLCTDSLSWIQHLSRGPQTPGSLLTMLWDALILAAAVADSVHVCHMFSHCDDPRSDFVDLQAKRGRACPPLPARWHVDAARPITRAAVLPHHSKMLEDRSEYGHLLWGKSKTYLASVHHLPPLRMSVRQAGIIMCLRSGYWPPLGAETFIFSQFRPFPCRLCGRTVDPEHSGAVRHLLTCPSSQVPLLSYVLSDDADQLAEVITHALRYAGRGHVNPPNNDILSPVGSQKNT